MKGDGATDVFQLAARDLSGGAIDVILDLGRGADRIDLSRFAEATSLNALNFGMLDGEVTIDIGAGRIQLCGVTDASELSAAQFIFAGGGATPPITTPPMSTPASHDTRVGGTGADVIPTGAGADTLIGGVGGDVFDIRLEGGSIDTQPDTVTDFSFATGDRIGISAALSGVAFDTLDQVVAVTPTGGATEIAIDHGAGFQTALVLAGVSFTFDYLAAYGFDATPRASVGFVENPYGFQNKNASRADPDATRDGCVVAFATDGVGVAADQNDQGDVYIRDLFNNTGPVLVNEGQNGLAAGGVAQPDFAADSTGLVALSANGRKVAFVSSADITGPGQIDANGQHDVYLRDLDAGTTTLVSTATSGVVAVGVRQPYSGFGDIIAMSDDGRHIAFMTATNVNSDDPNGLLDIYLKDTETGEMLFVTKAASNGVFGFDLSADASRIAFLTDSAIDADDTNRARDVYVADIDLASLTVTKTFRASEAPGGLQINGEDAESPVISPDGDRIAWVTAAEGVAFFDPTGEADEGNRIFVRDLTTGVVSAPVGPTPDKTFFDSEYAVFTDDTLIYRKEVPAAGN